MIIDMKVNASADEINFVCEKMGQYGYKPHVVRRGPNIRIGALGFSKNYGNLESLNGAPGVARLVRTEAYKLVGRDLNPEKTVVRVRDLEIGGEEFIVMAGPCSVETRDQLMETAQAVKGAGAQLLRGGAYKPRTSPYEFQGLEIDGLRMLAEAGRRTGLKVVTETVTAEDVDVVAKYADILQVGARNMQNFALLKKLGRADRPVLLKRGMSSTIKELLLSAEYIASYGNSQIVLCERGIRTFESSTRNTLDLAGVAMLRELTHLPIIVDPSHGTGRRSLIRPASKAAVAVGADGLIIEVHRRPDEAWSDGDQSMSPPEFTDLMDDLRRYVPLEARWLN
jgi:3-deoxy-7-phosphoheptulonate synthase